MAAVADSELNATCELLRQLAVSMLHRDDGATSSAAAITTSGGGLAGSESAKYLLRDVVNPALCVVGRR